MTAATGRPHLTPEVYERFAAYKAQHPTWGSLHIVLDDANIEDDSVDFCIKWAADHGDAEGEALARLLRTYTKSQRLRLRRRL